MHSRRDEEQELGADYSLWSSVARQRPCRDLLETIVNVALRSRFRPWVSFRASAVVNDRAKPSSRSKMNSLVRRAGDPDLALVQVRIVHANYWDVKESKIVQLWEMAKAAVTGKTPDLGEHGEVRLR